MNIFVIYLTGSLLVLLILILDFIINKVEIMRVGDIFESLFLIFISWAGVFASVFVIIQNTSFLEKIVWKRKYKGINSPSSNGKEA